MYYCHECNVSCKFSTCLRGYCTPNQKLACTLRKPGSNIRVVFRIILFWSFKGNFWSNLDRFDPFSDQYLQMDQIHQDHFWSDFRIILFWSFEGHFWSNLDYFDPFSDQYLQMDQIHQDHFWSDFRIKVLIRIWSGKDELIFDTAFGSKVILFVSYLILAF